MREMKPIPSAAAAEIAHAYGYDQVIIIARRVSVEAEPGGEHVTSYGVTEEHCSVAALVADHFKFSVMRWDRDDVTVYERKGDFSPPP